MSIFNWNATETEYYVDQVNKMMQSQNYGWNPGGSNGKGDAIGGNLDAWFAYGEPRLVDGVKNCWTKVDKGNGKYYYQGHRYPTTEYLTKDFSRDHTSNTFCLMKLAGEDEWLKELTSNIHWVISKGHITSTGKKVWRHSFGPGLWGFAKTFAGKWWGPVMFYTSSFFEVILYNIINAFCYLMGWFSRELKPEDYNGKNMSRQQQSKWRQFWASVTYPVYAMNLFAWQLFVMKDSFMKRLLQYMMKPLIPRYNYFLKLAYNIDKVTKEDVLEYKSMKGGRWSTPLNEINDRDVHFITDPKRLEFNVVDEDLLIAFWNYRHPEDKI